MARILIVDDDESIRRLIVRVLVRGGHEIETAENGMRAMERISKESFDLVITDIVMPEQEGTETITALRKAHPETKIIAMSGEGQTGPDSYLHVARLLGAAGTLAKPFLPDDIIRAVNLALQV